MKHLFTIITIVVLVACVLVAPAAASEVSPATTPEAPIEVEGQIDTVALLEAMSPFIQSILEILFTALAAFAVYYLRLYMVQLVQRLRQNTTAEQFWLIRTIVDSIVMAAEQIFEDNDEKKQYAIQFAEQALAEYGLHLDLDILDAIVEASVREQFHNKPPVWENGPVTTLPAGAMTQ